MDLPDIANQFERNIRDGAPILKDTPIDAGTSTEWFQSVIDPGRFRMQNPALDSDDYSVRVKGTAPFLGVDAVGVVVGYRLIQGSPYFTATAALSGPAGFDALRLSDGSLQLEWDYGPLPGDDEPVFPISLYRYHATLPIGQTKLPVTIRPPMDRRTWRLTSQPTPAVKLPGLNPLLDWLPVAKPLEVIPPALRSLSDIRIRNLAMGFDPQAGVVNSARVTLGLNKSVPLIPGSKQLTLENGILTVGFERDDQGKIDLRATALGNVTLGKAVLGVRVGFDAGRKSTELGLISEDFMLPGLSDLAAVIGGEGALDAIPPKIRDLNSLRLKEMALAIAASGQFDARIALDCPAPIEISDAVAVEGAAMTLALNGGSTPALSATFSGFLRIGANSVAVRGGLDKTVSFSGYIAEIRAGELIAAYFSQLPKGLHGIALKDVALGFDGRHLGFDCATDLPLGQWAAAMGIPLPDGFSSDIKLSTVRIGVVLAPEFEVSLEIGAELSPPAAFPQSGPTRLEVRSVRVAWSSMSGVAGDIQLAGRLSVGKDVGFTVPSLALGYRNGGWEGEAAVNAQLYGQSVTGFVAGIKDNVFRIERKAGQRLALIDVKGIAACTIRTFSFELARNRRNQDKDTGWAFRLAGDGELAIGPQDAWGFSARFELKLENESLRLEVAGPETIRVPVGPGGVSELELEFSALGVVFAEDWKIVGRGTGRLNNLPDIVKEYYPSRLPDITLEAGKAGVSVACDLAEAKLAPAISLFKVGEKAASPRLRVTAMEVDLGQTPSIASLIHVDRLKDLNLIFGRREDGRPRVDFLNDAFDLRLTLAKKIRLQLESGSPIKQIRLQKDPETGDLFFVLDLGRGLNRFKVIMPTLAWSGSAWSGSGGLEILDGRSLLLPLQPLKFILGRLGLGAVADVMPDSVPIDAFDIKKPFRDVLSAAASKAKVAALYKDSTTKAILNEFDEKVWTPLGSLVHKLPAAFRPYTSPPDLRSIRLSLAATPGGGFSGGLRLSSKDGGAVRFMLPFFGGIVPELIGLSLTRLEIGQSVGGIATFTVDGAVDRFDLVTLVIAATNAAAKSEWLPQKEIDGLCDHLELSDVFGAFFAGFPVPVPIFYEKISWGYKNWWGLEGRSQCTLQPGKEVTFWSMIAALMPFFTRKGYRLVKNRQKDAFRLNFAAGPAYIKLPGYLGVRKPLGATGATPTLPADVSVRWILDACKFVNPGYAIRSIPLQVPGSDRYIRIGTETVVFGPLSLDVGWCVTTEEEFKEDKEISRLLAAIDASKTLRHLPQAKTGAAYDKGFIVVLAGAANLAGVLRYQAQFGMAVTSTGGFESRIFMEGGIADVVTLAIDGGIQVQRDGSTQIDSGCDLKIAGMSVIRTDGSIKVTDRSFFIGCKLTIADTLSFGGDLYIGKDGVYIAIKSGVWQYASDRTIDSGAQASAAFTADGMVLRLEGRRIYGTDASLSIYVDKHGRPGVLIEAEVSELNKLFLKDIGKTLDEVRAEIDKQNPGLKALIEKNINNVNNFDDIRRGLPSFLDGIKRNVLAAVRSKTGSIYNGLSGTKRAAVNAHYKRILIPPGKKDASARNRLRADAAKEAVKFLAPLASLKAGLLAIERQKIVDEEERVARTKKAIDKALTDTINLDGTKKNIKVLGFTVKSIPVNFDTRELIALRQLVNTLPNDFSNADQEKARIAKTVAGRTASALEKITSSIENRVKDQIPQLQSVSVDTSLDGLKEPRVGVTVVVQQGHVTKTVKPELDLLNPGKTIRNITSSFVQAMVG